MNKNNEPESISKLTTLQKTGIVLGILVSIGLLYMLAKNSFPFSGDNDPFIVIDDFSQYRYLNVFGKEKLLASTITEFKRISNAIDQYDDSILQRLLKATCKNFLFYGPPGTGKTLFVKKVAFYYDLELKLQSLEEKMGSDKFKLSEQTYEECKKQKSQLKLFLVQPSSLIDKYVGTTEKNIRKLFERASAESKNSTVIIFIDEIDAFFSQRGQQTSTEHGRNAQNEFLQSLDGAKTDLKDKIFIFGATNYESNIDNAFLRRMPMQVKFNLPTFKERCDIIQRFMEGNDWIVKEKIENLATISDKMSQNDIATAVAELMGKNENFTDRFSYEDFENVLLKRQKAKNTDGLVPVEFELSTKQKQALKYTKIMPDAGWN